MRLEQGSQGCHLIRRWRKCWKRVGNLPSRMFEKLKKEILGHKVVYVLLFAALVMGLFIRIYRTGAILGFYFDQGRDALKIWDFWHKGDIMLIGPTTGIAGILRGPFYYYLIAPFYLLGGGDPVAPAVFLAVLSIAAVVVLYYLGAKYFNRTVGLFAAIVASGSFYIMLASRWLSNPTPMLLLSVLLLWCMFAIHDGKKWLWVVVAFIAGSSLFHFFIWQMKRKNLPGVKIILVSIGAFVFTALPQVIFDIKSGGLLRASIAKFLIGEKSFKISFWEVMGQRFKFYYDVFASKIFHWIRPRELALLAVVGGSFLIFFRKLWQSDYFKITFLLFASPIVGLFFFQGNFGNIYDYYLTGYYLIFVLLFAIVLVEIWKLKWLGKAFVAFFFWVFITWNGMVDRYKIIAGFDGPGTVVLGNQKQAIDWIYEDAAGRPFNTDVYVPPVIPHAYDYLFLWLGTTKYGYVPQGSEGDLLYTLYEDDPPHPERLAEWLARQAGIGQVEQETSFGGITVQRRARIK